MSPPAHASSAGQVGDPRPLHTVASSSTHDGMDSIQTGKWFPTPVASSAARAACSSPSPALSLNLQLTVACTPAALLDTGSRAAPSYSTGSSCIGPGQAGYGPELKRFILLFSSLMIRARIKRRVPERSSCFANRKELVFFLWVLL
jgi:hypothetical protein